MKRFLSVSMLMVIAVSSWGDPPARPEVGPLVQANNAFALDLFGRLRQNEGNVVFSPYVVSSSLAMTSFGARGRTADELNRAVHLLDQPRLHLAYQSLNETIATADDSRLPVRFQVKTSLIGYQDTVFSPAFLTVARTSYGAAKERTDLIVTNPQRLIKPIKDESTPEKLPVRAVTEPTDVLPLKLISEVQLTIAQESSLPATATPPATFHLANGNKVQIAHQRQTGLFSWAETEDLQLVELPYPESDRSLVLLLPQGMTTLETLEKKLSLEMLVQTLNKATPREVDVKLPRCHIGVELSLKKPLTHLGLGILFDKGADLSGLSDAGNIFLGDVVHQAAIDFGSCNAVSVTLRPGSGGAAVVSRAPPAVFQADRPFLFLVRDSGTGAILLMGRVSDPTK